MQLVVKSYWWHIICIFHAPGHTHSINTFLKAFYLRINCLPRAALIFRISCIGGRQMKALFCACKFCWKIPCDKNMNKTTSRFSGIWTKRPNETWKKPHSGMFFRLCSLFPSIPASSPNPCNSSLLFLQLSLRDTNPLSISHMSNLSPNCQGFVSLAGIWKHIEPRMQSSAS